MLESRYMSRILVYLSRKWSHTSETIIRDVESQYFLSVVRPHVWYLLRPLGTRTALCI